MEIHTWWEFIGLCAMLAATCTLVAVHVGVKGYAFRTIFIVLIPISLGFAVAWASESGLLVIRMVQAPAYAQGVVAFAVALIPMLIGLAWGSAARGSMLSRETPEF